MPESAPAIGDGNIYIPVSPTQSLCIAVRDKDGIRKDQKQGRFPGDLSKIVGELGLKVIAQLAKQHDLKTGERPELGQFAARFTLSTGKTDFFYEQDKAASVFNSLYSKPHKDINWEPLDHELDEVKEIDESSLQIADAILTRQSVGEATSEYDPRDEYGSLATSFQTNWKRGQTYASLPATGSTSSPHLYPDSYSDDSDDEISESELPVVDSQLENEAVITLSQNRPPRPSPVAQVKKSTPAPLLDIRARKDKEFKDSMDSVPLPLNWNDEIQRKAYLALLKAKADRLNASLNASLAFLGPDKLNEVNHLDPKISILEYVNSKIESHGFRAEIRKELDELFNENI